MIVDCPAKEKCVLLGVDEGTQAENNVMPHHLQQFNDMVNATLVCQFKMEEGLTKLEDKLHLTLGK